ncbi:uncharacterized protein LOC101863569 [Aplysia californica]|uniref:Uncharacterized protein LOC101863569 n=1 Tax=Aplysia californica TaxID=6500 RepID=A0ABM0JFL9_APLCA|nr:uncharacterized protein LOC101863569 [Aplysia californica]
MATPTTLNVGEPADERSVDAENVPDAAQSSSSGDQEKIYNEPPPITDFFAFSSLADEDEIQMRRYPYNRNYDDDAKGDSDGDSSIDNFWRMFPEFQIRASDVCFKITPAIGAVCYEYFSLSVMDPQWFSRAFGNSESMVKNIVWFHAHMGAGLYLYSRRHIRKVHPVSRGIFYSMFGSILFNFGSLLLWGWGRSILPQSPALRSVCGLLSGGALLYAAQDYLQHVDSSCSELD